MISLFYCHSKYPILSDEKQAVYNVASIWAISLESERQTHFILCIITHNRCWCRQTSKKQLYTSMLKSLQEPMCCTQRQAIYVCYFKLMLLTAWFHTCPLFIFHFLFSLCSYLKLLCKITVSYEEFKTLISHTLSQKARNVTQQFPCHIPCQD